MRSGIFIEGAGDLIALDSATAKDIAQVAVKY